MLQRDALAMEPARQPSENIYNVGTSNGPILRKRQVRFQEYIYCRHTDGAGAFMLMGEAVN